MADWAVPIVNRSRYETTFNATDVSRSGFMTGVQARNVLVQSGLPQNLLAQIWNLSDIDTDGRLSLEEFQLAMHLIETARAGLPVPATLPPELIPPSFRRKPSVPPVPPPPAMFQPQVAPAPPVPPPPQPVQDWAVPLFDRQRFGQMFSQNDTARTGVMTGLQARNILMGTGVPPQQLAHIWNLSDVNTDGNLNVEEFILAMHFIEKVKAGQPIPPSLPPEYMPPFIRPKPAGPPPPVPPAPSVIPQAMPPVAAVPPSRPTPPAVVPAPLPVSVPQGMVTGRSPSITSSSGDGVVWLIPQQTRILFSQQFNGLDKERSGFLTGTQARGLLVQSGLPQQALAQIWNLSDINVDGRLTCEEFILAMYLIEQTKIGKPLPTTLPPDLVPPSYRKGSRSGSVVSETAAAPAVPPPPASLDQPPPPAGVMMTDWAIPHPSKLKYVQMFNTHDRSRSGFLTGVQARGILVQSALPQDALAKIWSLCDASLSGMLTCEEFVLAMHLIDMVRAGDQIPSILPSDLIPPSHRRRKSHSSSVSSVGSGTGAASAVAAVDIEPQSPGKITSFEDKRKENYDRGQAVLDRKRQVLMDQQKREQDERERKEREEQAKREKIRLEMERKRQEEIEKQLAKQREIEEEKEEARRKELERREAARREMERQRMIEWESQRIQELTIQKQRVVEAISSLKSKKKSLVIQVESVNKEYSDAETTLTTARDKVKEGKSVIDGMRVERDEKMKKISLSNAETKALTEKEVYIKKEKERIAKELQAELSAANNNLEGEDVTKIALQNKQVKMAQMKEQMTDLEQEKEQKSKDSSVMKQSLDEITSSLNEIKTRVRDLQSNYNKSVQKAKEAKEKILEKQANFDPNADWGAAPAAYEVVTSVADQANEIVSSVTAAAIQQVESMSGDRKMYHVVYPFEARNGDELTLNPGDVVYVIPDPSAEEGWLKGDLNGAIGWFPEAYAEPADALGTFEPPAPAATESWPIDNQVTAPAAVETKAEPVTQTNNVTTNVSAGESYLAIYPWAGKEGNHLSFEKNEVILVTEKQDEWFYGEVKGSSARTGWFPASYVKNVAAGTEPEFEEFFVALYPFESQEPGDLGFESGDVIKVTKKDGEWWTGEIGDRTGVFPSNYVREAEANEIVSTFCLLYNTIQWNANLLTR